MDDRRPTSPPSLVVIGNFDGVHRGHAAVLRAASELAQRARLTPTLLTFDPHPVEVLRGPEAVTRLTSTPRKVELVERSFPGFRVVVEPFTHELASVAAADFARGILAERLAARHVVVGEDFCFGRGRSGDVTLLRTLGAGLGFEVHAQALVGDATGIWSSSRARQALATGELAALESILGRPHSVAGRVVEGARRGRTLGFPTANVADLREALPPDGVYACAVDVPDPAGGARAALHRGVANLGVRPTLGGGGARVLEVHLIDFSGDLYGRTLRAHLVARLREERRFDGLPALTAQIARDTADARAALEHRVPDPDARGWY
ncbi:MAG: bifunctional riboflavin kinase/FAD synthetase [Polyangiaceae bacterium]|nr:bifunctional riboflavin kinase/FAD synthetase [Polyangiaceae bacterium]